MVGINNKGQFVWTAGAPGWGSNFHAFIYGRNGMIDLRGALGGLFGNAFGANEKGEVVGTSEVSSRCLINHAFACSGGMMRDIGRCRL
ncbi:MAG TPA: hypothetical protein VF450_21980 [Noviherbaspirillum sp.]